MIALAELLVAFASGADSSTPPRAAHRGSLKTVLAERPAARRAVGQVQLLF